MEKLCFIVLTVSAFALVQGAVLSSGSTKVVCRNDTQCGVGECCYIQPEFLVASKKRAVALQPLDLLQPVHIKHDTGYCEAYHALNGHCYPLETMNGHCGCPPSSRCQWVPDGPAPTAHILPMPSGSNIRRRSMVYHPEPGSYRCVQSP